MDRAELTKHLTNFEKWENSDHEFDIYDYISATLQNLTGNVEEVNSIIIAISELFYPRFIEHNGSIFLNEIFSENKYHELKNNTNIKDTAELETWMNIINLDGIFQDMDFALCCELGKKISMIWGQKLSLEYPNRKFKVDYSDDIDVNDILISFHEL